MKPKPKRHTFTAEELYEVRNKTFKRLTYVPALWLYQADHVKAAYFAMARYVNRKLRGN